MWLFPFFPMWSHRRDLKWLNIGGSITLLKMFRCTSKSNYHCIDLNSLSWRQQNGKKASKLFWKVAASLLFECNPGGSQIGGIVAQIVCSYGASQEQQCRIQIQAQIAKGGVKSFLQTSILTFFSVKEVMKLVIMAD